MDLLGSDHSCVLCQVEQQVCRAFFSTFQMCFTSFALRKSLREGERIMENKGKGRKDKIIDDAKGKDRIMTLRQLVLLWTDR